MCSPIALSVVENITSAANKGVELYQEAKNNEYRIQIAKNNAEIALKNNIGRSSFTKFTIINKILIPSLIVESLLSEPTGRAK